MKLYNTEGFNAEKENQSSMKSKEKGNVQIFRNLPVLFRFQFLNNLYSLQNYEILFLMSKDLKIFEKLSEL